MIVLTGGAGFIGSVMLAHLNAQGIDDVLVVDNLGTGEKWKNLRGKRFRDYLHRDELLRRIERNELQKPRAVIHLGACSATTERDMEYLMRNNVHYSQILARYALEQDARFIYASSAATYGLGERGYRDAEDEVYSLQPLNGYGYSKLLFDQWVVREKLHNKVCGLRFFNVYGPNEYHKGGMMSVAFKAFEQVQQGGVVKLFASNDSRFADGEQQRDFIYVKDCATVMGWLLEHREANGIFNLGTGTARTWNDLAKAVFAALGKSPVINYIPIPEHLAAQYQNFTRAEMEKLRKVGYRAPFTSLEDGVRDYVQQHLLKERYL
jgi:ADP-L-glycero-D-manno-heptose 6-epimerase